MKRRMGGAWWKVRVLAFMVACAGLSGSVWRLRVLWRCVVEVGVVGVCGNVVCDTVKSVVGTSSGGAG